MSIEFHRQREKIKEKHRSKCFAHIFKRTQLNSANKFDKRKKKLEEKPNHSIVDIWLVRLVGFISNISRIACFVPCSICTQWNHTYVNTHWNSLKMRLANIPFWIHTIKMCGMMRRWGGKKLPHLKMNNTVDEWKREKRKEKRNKTRTKRERNPYKA